jgi:hypothetical protein
MASWRYYLAFWSRRSTATVVPASTASDARRRATARRKVGYGSLVSVQQANDADRRLIRQCVWVRRRRNGTSPQFGSAPARAGASRQRSRYRPWL